MEQIPDTLPEEARQPGRLVDASTVYDALQESMNPLEDAFGITLYAMQEKHDFPYEETFEHIHTAHRLAEHSADINESDKLMLQALYERFRTTHAERVSEVEGIISGLLSEHPGLLHVRSTVEGEERWELVRGCRQADTDGMPGLAFTVGKDVLKANPTVQVRCNVEALPEEAQQAVSRYIADCGE